MRTFKNCMLSIVVIALFISVSGCGGMATEGVALRADKSGLGTEAAIKKYLSGRDLDPIEGVWVDGKNSYDIVITKNTFGIKPIYQYVGIISRAEMGSWKPGEIKLLIRETASPSVFAGVWYLGNKNPWKVSFVMNNNNMVTAIFSSDSSPSALIRVFPKNNAKRKKSVLASSGSGFFVSTDGLIITNHHVIKGAKKIAITTLNGDRLTAKVVAKSASTDLALLKVPYFTATFLRLEGVGKAKIGDSVFTIGYPLSSLLGGEPKYSNGVVNSLSGIKGDATYIQISVPIQPGNSGGPLLNRRGNVIGIVSSTAAVSTFLRVTGTLPQNVNWAVKADYAMLLSPKLRMDSQVVEIADPIDNAKKSTVFVEVTR